MEKTLALSKAQRDILKRCILINDCWVWIGGQNGYGYGQYKGQRVNRVLLNLKPDEVAYQLCDCRVCCNPRHIEVISQVEKCIRARHGYPKPDIGCGLDYLDVAELKQDPSFKPRESVLDLIESGEIEVDSKLSK